MTNPLSGIITQAHKDLFNNAIDALLEDQALTLPCITVYSDTQFTECANCILDTNAGISSNKYKVGGPASFPVGSICPMCAGRGFIPVESTEQFNVATIFKRSKFILLGGAVDVNEIDAQTICAATNYTKLTRAKYVILNASPLGYDTQDNNRYQRLGNPMSLGFGDDRYILTNWKKVK